MTSTPSPGPSEVVLVTIVRGRHAHLRRQREWVARLDPAPARHVVVSMGDPDVAAVLKDAVLKDAVLEDAVLGEAMPRDRVPGPVPVQLVDLPVGAELPLSAARNAGVAAAEAAGAQVVLLLDVDCLPEPGFVADHLAALAQVAGEAGPAVTVGRVRYLPAGLGESEHTPEHLDAIAPDHPARVVPAPGEVRAGDPRLLWSLNVGVTVADWHRIGGFDERYVGYGGEDTDFGQRLAAAGGAMWWTAGAGVFHQWHPVSSPPVEHAAAIARNVNLFRRTWGWEPMEGWVAALEQRGALARDQRGELYAAPGAAACETMPARPEEETR